MPHSDPSVARQYNTEYRRQWRKDHPEKLEAYHESNREWRAANADRLRDYDLQRAYGITLEMYREMLLDQAGVCAVCGKTCSSGHSLSVDHDHSTGLVRGLLCKSCNLGVGNFSDDPDLLRSAAWYLEKSL